MLIFINHKLKYYKRKKFFIGFGTLISAIFINLYIVNANDILFTSKPIDCQYIVPIKIL